jgi:hypothetical protein
MTNTLKKFCVGAAVIAAVAVTGIGARSMGSRAASVPTVEVSALEALASRYERESVLAEMYAYIFYDMPATHAWFLSRSESYAAVADELRALTRKNGGAK